MEQEKKIYKGQQASAAEFEKQNGTPPTNESPIGNVAPPTGLPPHIKSLMITCDTSNGNLQVSGPIEDKVLVYGMLEAAKDVIQEHNAKRCQPSEIKKF